MAQYRNDRKSSNSRGRGQSRGRTGGGSRSNSGAGGYSSGSGRYRKLRKRQKNSSGSPIAVGLLGIVLLAVCIFSIRNGFFSGDKLMESSAEESTEVFDPEVIRDDIYLDYSALDESAALISLKGMNREALKSKLKESYSWSLTIKNENPNISLFKLPELPAQSESSTALNPSAQDNEGTEEIVEIDNPLSKISIRPDKAEFRIPDLLSAALDSQVEDIFSDYESRASLMTVEESTEVSTEASGFFGLKRKQEESSAETESSSRELKADYVISLPDFTEQLADIASQLAVVWKMQPENGDISSYDASSGEFVFAGSTDGYKIDADATAKRIIELANAGSFSESIAAVGEKIPASSSSIKDQYKIIGTFTTNTTSNPIRNQNVKLAAQAVNGTVLKPGEEFSFNEVVGERTAAKGYGAAAAYNGGEVVQEIGGGVCQVSSTLYNVVFRTGLTTTYRRSHTFAPNYVRPGSDATISWGGPDYKFVNNSKHAIGIRAWYKDQTCTVQIYGIPVLPSGETWELVTEKVEDLPVPAPQIITPEQGSETNGSAGSRWIAYKLIKKNGKEEKVQDHKVTYKGHTPKKYAESLQESTEAATAQEGETAAGDSTAKATEGTAVVSEGTREIAVSQDNAGDAIIYDGPSATDGGIISHPGNDGFSSPSPVDDNDYIPAGPGA